MSTRKLEVITGIHPNDFAAEVNVFISDADVELINITYSANYRGEGSSTSTLYIAFIDYEEKVTEHDLRAGADE